MSVKHNIGFINVDVQKPKRDPFSVQYDFTPIGVIETVFGQKHGTPRQGGLTPDVRGRLRFRKDLSHPDFSQGLSQFTHAWLIWCFHLNNNERKSTKALIKPPRSEEKWGIFATRTPHRPNPIGLTLVRIVRVEKGSILLSGLDLIANTPILDIKPYVHQDCESEFSTPNWVQAKHRFLKINFISTIPDQLNSFLVDPGLKYYSLDESDIVLRAISQTLSLDPRSRQHKKLQAERNVYALHFDVLEVIYSVEGETATVWKLEVNGTQRTGDEWFMEKMKEKEEIFSDANLDIFRI